jgi:hypothetical protein
VSAVVLQVTESSVPAAALGCTKMALFAVTAVVDTTQVAADALVAQENDPAGAAEQATSDGLAPVPTAAHFVADPNVALVTVPPLITVLAGLAPVPLTVSSPFTAVPPLIVRLPDSAVTFCTPSAGV